MKSKADFSLHFYPRAYPTGKIMWAYVSLKGQKSKPFSTGIKLQRSEVWLRTSRIIKGNPDATQLLRVMEGELNDIYLSFRRAGLMPTPDQVVKKRDNSGPAPSVLLKDFLQDYYDTEAEKEGINKEVSTLESYRAKIKAIYGFLSFKNCQDIALNELQPSFGDELLHYLTTHKRYSREHIRKIVQLLKRVANVAVRRGLLESNPIDVKLKRKPDAAPVFLTAAEFEAFRGLKPAGQQLRKAQDLFLWQCHTGQSYADMRGFVWQKHVHYHQGTPYVSQMRKKMATTTQETAKFPLAPEAVAIWQKYGNRLPIISAQRYNSALKELGELAGINKQLTSHAARRTAGRLWLNAGVSMEVVATMLGHSDMRTTQQIYAAIDFDRLHRETQVLTQKKAGATNTGQISHP